jgi:hypothetical protein
MRQPKAIVVFLAVMTSYQLGGFSFSNKSSQKLGGSGSSGSSSLAAVADLLEVQFLQSIAKLNLTLAAANPLCARPSLAVVAENPVLRAYQSRS